MNAANLFENGYVRIEFRGEAIDRVIEGFKRLLAEPEEYKRAWLFDLGFDPEPDDGLVPKRHDDGKDQKWFFHYRTWLVSHLRERARNRPDFDFVRYENWLNELHMLHRECLRAVMRVCRELGDELGEDLAMRVALSPFHVLRLLWYEEPHAGTNVIGKLHTDKAGFTIAVADNRPGLELNEQLMHHREGSAIFFAGNKAQFATNGRIEPMPHRAVLNSADGENRWAIVFFAHLDLGEPGLIQFPGRPAAAK